MAIVKEFKGVVPKIEGYTFYKSHGKLIVRRKSSLKKERIMTDAVFENTRRNMRVMGSASGINKSLRVLLAGFLHALGGSVPFGNLQKLCYGMVRSHINIHGIDVPLVLKDYRALFDGFVMGTEGFNATSLRPTLVKKTDGTGALEWALDTLDAELVLLKCQGATHYQLVLGGCVMAEHCIESYGVESGNGDVLGFVCSDYIDMTVPKFERGLVLPITSVVKERDSIVAVLGVFFYVKEHDRFTRLYNSRPCGLVVV